MRAAVVVLSRRGWELARKLAPEGQVYAPAGLGVGVPYRSLRQLVEELFSRCEALIMIMAAGIAVRLVAPHLRDKFNDPAVVVVDEGGRFAVSLLGGHYRGANELAARVARTLGAQAVITTAADVLGRPAVDVFARRYRLNLAPRPNLPRVAGALLRGEQVAIVWDRDLPTVEQCWPPEVRVLAWSPGEPWPSEGEALIVVTDKLVAPPPVLHLFLCPRRLVAGVGCRRGASGREILNALREATARCGLALEAVGTLATVDRKRGEPGLLEAAEVLGAELRFYAASELSEWHRTLGRGAVGESSFVRRTVGVANVCELAALLAAGARELVAPKTVMSRVTVALALAPWP